MNDPGHSYIASSTDLYDLFPHISPIDNTDIATGNGARDQDHGHNYADLATKEASRSSRSKPEMMVPALAYQ